MRETDGQDDLSAAESYQTLEAAIRRADVLRASIIARGLRFDADHE